MYKRQGQRTDTAVYEELHRRGQVSGYLVANTNDNDPRIACLLANNIPFASFCLLYTSRCV